MRGLKNDGCRSTRKASLKWLLNVEKRILFLPLNWAAAQCAIWKAGRRRLSRKTWTAPAVSKQAAVITHGWKIQQQVPLCIGNNLWKGFARLTVCKQRRTEDNLKNCCSYSRITEFTGGYLLHMTRIIVDSIIRFPSVPSVPDDFTRKGLKRIYRVRIVNHQCGLSAPEHRPVSVC